MLLSLAYKEWIKIRWAYLVSLAIGLGIILSIFLNLRLLVEFNSLKELWNYIIFKNYLFYSQFRFIPLLIGLILGIAQFVPEIQNLRLKLALHLPIEETKTLFFMVFYGFALLTAIFLFFYLILVSISSSYFPPDITNTIFITLLPWYTAGYAVYFFASVIIIEQIWVRRISISLFAVLLISQFFHTMNHNAYIKIIIPIFLFVILLSTLIITSGYRFKRGLR